MKWMIAGVILLITAIEDIRKREIAIFWLVLFCGVALADIFIVLCTHCPFAWCWSTEHAPGTTMTTLLLRMLTGGMPGGVLLLCSFVWGKHIGPGDGWILILLGAYCGGAMICEILLYACVCLLFCGICLLVQKRKPVLSIPFLPFLCSGYLIFGFLNVI